MASRNQGQVTAREKIISHSYKCKEENLANSCMNLEVDRSSEPPKLQMVLVVGEAAPLEREALETGNSVPKALSPGLLGSWS